MMTCSRRNVNGPLMTCSIRTISRRSVNYLNTLTCYVLSSLIRRLKCTWYHPQLTRFGSLNRITLNSIVTLKQLSDVGVCLKKTCGLSWVGINGLQVLGKLPMSKVNGLCQYSNVTNGCDVLSNMIRNVNTITRSGLFNNGTKNINKSSLMRLKNYKNQACITNVL